MYTSEFAYKKASSVAEALSLMAQHPDAKVLAGGHSLIPTMKLRLASPSALIDISKIPALKAIRMEGDTLVIGAAATYHEVESNAQVKAAAPMLPEAIHLIGDPMVRARGTIGGSLAHSDPAADLPAVMVALGAKMKVQGQNGWRLVEADDFFKGMFETAVGEGELLTEIHVPANAGKQAYAKFPHPASRYAVVGVAVVVGSGGVRAAVTGAGAHAMRLSKLEANLAGKEMTAANIAAATENIISADGLNHDLVASAEYRAHLVGVMAKRALMSVAFGGGEDLERIEGIGPKIAEALRAAGIRTFSQLAAASDDTLKSALNRASMPFAPSLGTWAEQSALLAKGDEAGFKALTDALTGGRRE